MCLWSFGEIREQTLFCFFSSSFNAKFYIKVRTFRHFIFLIFFVVGSVLLRDTPRHVWPSSKLPRSDFTPSADAHRADGRTFILQSGSLLWCHWHGAQPALCIKAVVNISLWSRKFARLQTAGREALRFRLVSAGASPLSGCFIISLISCLTLMQFTDPLLPPTFLSF